ncbi:hypothetical protein B5F40_05520 [Gordonibacter sp. An230]|uniref:hypothetical protein n=1 Tax=Gordonibacter sp. An230 TaxID=1965592 RepID=UPI000B377B0E|nr:hypothetical protein [Gordonibacter sp. An230]OUO90918.1 hypothetical protein B5F40_05520 [Gordonibacter sp. An230]
MSKVVFECSANGALFLLMGAAFMFPFEVHELSVTARGFAFSVSASPMLLAFLASLLAWALVRFAFIRRMRTRTSLWEGLELAAEDERERFISSRALRSAYVAAMVGLTACLGVLAAAYVFGLLAEAPTSTMYRVAVGCVVGVLFVVNAAYCVRWCVEYRR